jgi:serine-type D-Ala-D-Ala carboxypeptidase/endopeptidase (penicillin-binding protein 4)
MTRWLLIPTLCLATLPALAPAQTAPASPEPAPLAQQIATLLAAPAVTRDHWGIQVTTLDGTPIYSLNEAQLFQPASNTKLFTTAAALALLGTDKKFQTQVAALGNLDKNGVLHGDLRLVGGGDPAFGARDLPYIAPAKRIKPTPAAPPSIVDIEDLADKVYASGLRVIEGDIVGDDSKFNWEPYPPDWALDDLVYGYGAPVSALSVNDNEVIVKVSPGVRKAIIETDPDVSYYTLENHVFATQTDEPHNCDLQIGYQREQGTKLLVLFGNIQPKQPPCTQAVAIADPAEYAAIAFKAALERRGIRVAGTAKAYHQVWRYPNPATRIDPMAKPMMPWILNRPYSPDASPNQCDAQSAGGTQEPDRAASPKDPHYVIVTQSPDPTVLATHDSPPLSEDVTYTLKVSQNLHAEVILRDVGAAYSCEHTHASGLTVLREFLLHAGLEKADFALVDGSGLSSHNLVTPRATAKLLQYATTQPWFALWKASLPVGGEDGTLESRFPNPPLKDHLFAKTGTLGEARALSGYLDAASGRTIIFSIMVGNHLPGDNSDREVMDRIVAAIQAAN